MVPDSVIRDLLPWVSFAFFLAYALGVHLRIRHGLIRIRVPVASVMMLVSIGILAAYVHLEFVAKLQFKGTGISFFSQAGLWAVFSLDLLKPFNMLGKDSDLEKNPNRVTP